MSNVIQAHRPSRRDFLVAGAGIGSSMLLRPMWLYAATDELDPSVTKVLAKTIGIDMHNHVYPDGSEPHPNFGPPRGGQGQPPQGGPPPQQRPEQEVGTELFLGEELKRSGLTAVSASYVLDFAKNDKPGDARKNLLGWFDLLDASLAKGHIRRALNLKDLQSAHDSGKPTIVQSVEGAMFLEGQLDRVGEVYERGLRQLQLLHMRDDMVAPLGDLNTDPPHLGGLTAFGADVVKECNRVGILVDMAHASHETVVGALKVATQPLVISHTSLDTYLGTNARMAEMMKPRLISKEHAKVVADAGGIVGVWTHMAASLPDFVGSIKATVDAIGIDHVGIGTDTDLLSSRKGAGTNQAYPHLTQGFFPGVVAEMLRQGFSADEIEKVGGGNYCRVFGKVTAGRS
jgi:membrane dipeptidase